MLANFKRDNFNPSAPIRHGGFHVDEPTRDPDIWPPPTPVERESRYLNILYIATDYYYKVNNFLGWKATLLYN